MPSIAIDSIDVYIDLDDGQTHLLELSKLAEKDPDFYKYLQENDRELLEFDISEQDENVMSDVEEDLGAETAPILTLSQLRGWSRALLKVVGQPSMRVDMN